MVEVEEEDVEVSDHRLTYTPTIMECVWRKGQVTLAYLGGVGQSEGVGGSNLY